jgi:hypothetical protein
MTNYLMSSNLIAILYLIALLIVLIVLRTIILKQINKIDVEIAQKIIIGYEEIQEDEIGVAESEAGIIGVLADGLGKSEAGRVSSIYAVKTIRDMFIREGSNSMYKYFFNKSYNKANHENGICMAQNHHSTEYCTSRKIPSALLSSELQKHREVPWQQGDDRSLCQHTRR